MDDKIAAMKKKNTWEIINLPKGQKPIKFKWVVKREHKEQLIVILLTTEV